MVDSTQPAGAMVIVRTATVRDQVFSPDGKYLYIASGGTVTAYSTASGSALQSWALGTTLGAIDLSPDGRYLVALETTPGKTTSTSSTSTTDFNVYRLDTVTGAQQTFVNHAASYDSYFYDASFLPNGTILLTQHFNGSGFEPLTTLDPSTGTFTRGNTSYYMDGGLNATPDHRVIVYTPEGISDAPIYVYTAGVGITASHGSYTDNVSGYNSGVQAISPDGSLIAEGVGLNIYNSSLKLQVSIATLYPEINSVMGMTFSADGKTLYLLSAQAHAIFALSTVDWSLTARYPIDITLPFANNGYGDELIASADGHYLSVIGTTGVELVDLTKAVSSPGTPGDDALTASSGYVYGFAGNDALSITGDVTGVRAGAGNDTIAITSIGSGTGASTGFIDGGAGDDTLDLSAIAAPIIQPASNGFVASVGNKTFTVSGIEHLVLGAGADAVALSSGDLSTLEIRGGAGNDSLQGGPNMTLRGEAGDDTIWLTGGATASTHGVVDGGAGIDLLRTGAGFTVDLSAGTAQNGMASYTVSGIENVMVTVAGATAHVTGDDGANTISVNPFRDDGTAGVVIDGKGGDDILSGSAGNDIINGGAGNDTIIGTAGSDTIDGGDGHDVVTIAALSHSYGITVANGVASLTLGSAKTTITNVEDTTFLDGHLIIDANSNGAQVERLYDAVLGRPADATGLDFWVHQIDAGTSTVASVAGALVGSGEFQAATGGLTNAQFVDYVYQHALGRASDQNGHDFWTGQLNTGLSRGDMVVGFSESAEHRAITANTIAAGYFDTDPIFQQVALLYDGAFGRLPDASGESFWAGSVKSGTSTLAQVADGFAASSEFSKATAGLSNSQLVEYMYEHTLHRSADVNGSAFWTDQLDHGLTKGALLLNFGESSEHFNPDAANIVSGIVIA